MPSDVLPGKDLLKLYKAFSWIRDRLSIAYPECKWYNEFDRSSLKDDDRVACGIIR